eukprot:4688034-Pleurochrysis_carterae.AAC.1
MRAHARARPRAHAHDHTTAHAAAAAQAQSDRGRDVLLGRVHFFKLYRAHLQKWVSADRRADARQALPSQECVTHARTHTHTLVRMHANTRSYT